MDMLHKIDKTSGVTAGKLEALGKSFDEHKYGENKWQERMEAAVQECPEAGHIKIQNGKITDMQVVLRAIRMITAGILVVGTLFGIFFGVMKYVDGSQHRQEMEVANR